MELAYIVEFLVRTCDQFYAKCYASPLAFPQAVVSGLWYFEYITTEYVLHRYLDTHKECSSESISKTPKCPVYVQNLLQDKSDRVGCAMATFRIQGSNVTDLTCIFNNGNSKEYYTVGPPCRIDEPRCSTKYPGLAIKNYINEVTERGAEAPTKSTTIATHSSDSIRTEKPSVKVNFENEKGHHPGGSTISGRVVIVVGALFLLVGIFGVLLGILLDRVLVPGHILVYSGQPVQ